MWPRVCFQLLVSKCLAFFRPGHRLGPLPVGWGASRLFALFQREIGLKEKPPWVQCVKTTRMRSSRSFNCLKMKEAAGGLRVHRGESNSIGPPTVPALPRGRSSPPLRTFPKRI